MTQKLVGRALANSSQDSKLVVLVDVAWESASGSGVGLGLGGERRFPRLLALARNSGLVQSIPGASFSARARANDSKSGSSLSMGAKCFSRATLISVPSPSSRRRALR